MQLLFVLYLNSGRSFSSSEGQFTDTGSQGRTVLSQKTSGSLERPKTPQTQSSLKFAGDDNTNRFPHRHAAIAAAFCLRPQVDYIFKQNTQVSKIKARLTCCNRKAEHINKINKNVKEKFFLCLLQRNKKKITSDLNRRRAGAEKRARKYFG